MPVLIRYLNDPNQDCVIRPAPFVSLVPTTNKTKDGPLGKTYTITLKGTILTDLGFPLARDTRSGDLFEYFDGSGGYIAASGNAGPYQSFDTTQSHAYFVDVNGNVTDNRPERQHIPYDSAVDAMLFKQKVLRSLFSRDGQRLEISAIHTDEPSIICYPRLVGDIQFTDGIYVDRSDYTITLEADVIYDKNFEVDLDGNPVFLEGSVVASGGMIDAEIVAASGRFVETYSDSWSLEGDDSLGESPDRPRSYRISRNISAVGKDYWGPKDLSDEGIEKVEKREAWEQARDFVQFKLQNDPVSSGYPNIMGQLGSGLLNLVDAYEGFNHRRTENISVTDGSYSVTEDWLLASGKAFENYDMSISASVDDPFIAVSMRGEIKGLTCLSPSGELYGGNFAEPTVLRPYDNALEKYYDISNSGQFGVSSDIFKRANNAVAVELNAQPQSVALATNEYDGSVTYSLEFNNRPTNIISGVLTENINVSDTYPGDVFAIIPVLGRETGPVLQYLGGRTEYKRDLNIDLLLDYNTIPYGSGGRSLLLKKPSIVEPTRSQLRELVKQLSPEFEPGVRKYFISPPTENWEPKNGRYSFSISWTYELSK